MRVLIASNNRHKVSEIRDALSPLGVEVVTPEEIGLTLDVVEDRATFEGNAAKKAEEFRSAVGMTVLADDSGLEVASLGGEPGVLSARYAGPGASDADRIELLLSKLEAAPGADRRARFVCVVAIAPVAGRTVLVRGECEGAIADSPRGRYGFGYDPVFLLPDRGLTMAELAPAAKNRLSHRGRAVRAARVVLARLADPAVDIQARTL
jgi:XTP/dITP diphosphohydrolase